VRRNLISSEERIFRTLMAEKNKQEKTRSEQIGGSMNLNWLFGKRELSEDLFKDRTIARANSENTKKKIHPRITLVPLTFCQVSLHRNKMCIQLLS
jgi:hypothetical protein